MHPFLKTLIFKKEIEIPFQCSVQAATENIVHYHDRRRSNFTVGTDNENEYAFEQYINKRYGEIKIDIACFSIHGNNRAVNFDKPRMLFWVFAITLVAAIAISVSAFLINHDYDTLSFLGISWFVIYHLTQAGFSTGTNRGQQWLEHKICAIDSIENRESAAPEN